MTKGGKKKVKRKPVKRKPSDQGWMKAASSHPAAKAIADIGDGYRKGGMPGAAIAGGHHALKFAAKRYLGNKKK